MMKRLFALAAFLLASTAAQAQYTFDYGGRTIRIDPDRGTVSIPGVYDNSGRRKRAHNDRDSDRPRKPSPEQAKVDPQTPATAPAPPDQAPSATTPPPEPSSTTANVAPADTAASPPPPTSSPAPVQQEVAPVTPPAPAPAAVAAPPPPPPPVQKQAAAAPTSTAQPTNTPLGLWLTEEKEGKVRIEQCGANLCGYSVDKKSNQNGEQVLINMKPAKDSKWSGRIFDPNTGNTYDSTIAMRGTDSLRVQGCAFGGMFCGGQTWSRLN
jgi:uncharacterized protein (DUF2147 family)